MVSARGLASLHELETIYSVEDLYDFLEILAIDAYNRKLLMDKDDE